MKLTTLLTNGLSVRDGIILSSLSEGARYPKDLVNDMMSAANVTKISDKLVAKKLITRSKNLLDKRGVVLAITKAGEEITSGR